MKSFFLLIFISLFIANSIALAQDNDSQKSIKFAGLVIDIPDTMIVLSVVKGNNWETRNHDNIYHHQEYFSPSFRANNQFYESSISSTAVRYLTKLGVPLSNADYLFDYQSDSKRSSLELGAIITRVYSLPYMSGLSNIKGLEASIDIEWQLFDNRSRTVVYKKKTRALSGAIKMNFPNPYGNTLFRTSHIESRGAIDIALHRSIDNLFKDSDFRQQLKETEINYMEIGTQETLVINQVGLSKNPKSSIDDAVNSTCSVVVGNGHGSGFFISSDGLFLTCEHVVGRRKTVDVMVSPGVTVKADVLRTNPEMDLALIKVNGVESKPIAIKKSRTTTSGEAVFTVGSPGSIDYFGTLSKGIISGHRVIEGNQYIQTDASVSPGNSGGPMLNEIGEVVGIVNAKLIGTGVEGVSFAIPIQEALDKLNIQIKP